MAENTVKEKAQKPKIVIQQTSDQLSIDIRWRDDSDIQLIIAGLFIIAVFGTIAYSMIGSFFADGSLGAAVSPFIGFLGLFGVAILLVIYFILGKMINTTNIRLTKDILKVTNKGLPFLISWKIPSTAIHQVYESDELLFVVDEQNRSRSLMGSIWRIPFPFPTTKGEHAKQIEDAIEKFLRIKDQNVIKKLEDIDQYKEAIVPAPYGIQVEDNDLGTLIMKHTKDGTTYKLLLVFMGVFFLTGWGSWIILFLDTWMDPKGTLAFKLLPAGIAAIFLGAVSAIFLYNFFKRNEIRVVRIQGDELALLANAKVLMVYPKQEIQAISIQTRIRRTSNDNSTSTKEYKVLHLKDIYGGRDILEESQAYTPEDLDYIAVRIEQWRRGLA
ncbi:MAG: hypothetical protein MK212_08385 [Saprospiraceae bacterium]|nr:hypothetical protein [Saprospiraceae bacterium]